ncbi:MAG: hypothetical protein IJD65_06100 [Mailhella sp.]|nr:hypothetical protein [Mailhella sp.]
MGSSGGSTTVQKADPWKGQQPYLTDVFTQAKEFYDSGVLSPDYYPGQTVAPKSPWSAQALEMQAERALAGSASVQGAQQAMDGIVSGQGLSGNAGLSVLGNIAQNEPNAGNAGLAALESMSSAQNPWMDRLYQDASREALSALDGSFSRAGRYGSGAHAAAQADAAAGLAAEMYGAAYQQQMQAAAQAANAYNAGVGQQIAAAQAAGQLYGAGVGQQIAAAGVAQGLANQGYADAAALSEAGALQESYAQQLINAQIDRWNHDQQKELAALAAYSQLIQGDYGSVTTTTAKQDSGAGKLGGFATGAATGASAGASIGGPWGALIGGIGGGILGLL